MHGTFKHVCVSLSRYRFYDQPVLFSLEMLHAGAVAVQQVAEELKDIANQLERRLVAEAAQNLRRNLLISTSDVSLTCSSEFNSEQLLCYRGYFKSKTT